MYTEAFSALEVVLHDSTSYN